MKKLFLLFLLPCFLLGFENPGKKISLYSFPSQPSQVALEKLKENQVFLAVFSHDAQVELFCCENQEMSIISATQYVKKEKNRDSYIWNCQGIKIGLFALMPNTKEDPTHLKLPLHFACEKVLKEFQKKGVELILLYSDLPIEEDQKIMKDFPEIDCVFGKHGEPLVFGFKENTFFYKTTHKNHEVYKIDLIIDKKGVKNLKIYPSLEILSLGEFQN